MKETRIYFSTVRSLLWLGVGIGLVYLSIRMYENGAEDDLLTLIFSGLVALAAVGFLFLGIKRLTSGKPQVVMNDKGIQIAEHAAKGLITWEDIERINLKEETSTRRTSYYLVLELTTEDKIRIAISSLKIGSSEMYVLAKEYHDKAKVQ